MLCYDDMQMPRISFRFLCMLAVHILILSSKNVR